MAQYSQYVRHIRLALEARGITARELSSDLIMMSATNHSHPQNSDLKLLSAHRAELKIAGDLYDIFELLTTEYASFLNYGIFQFILNTYGIDTQREEFQYPQHLEAYINKHKIKEFVEINPLLSKSTEVLENLILKIDIESTSELAKLVDLQTAIAEILGVRSATLQLLDVKDGCVVVTFLIPKPVAEVVFSKHATFSDEQLDMFRALSILWLECNNHVIDFTAKSKVVQSADYAETVEAADTPRRVQFQ